MYLVVSSTKMELDSIKNLFHDSDKVSFLLSGVGPVESAINLTNYLSCSEKGSIAGVINVGLAGAYPDSGVSPIEICLADKEVFGDIGICMKDRVDDLDSSFAPPIEFELDPEFLTTAEIHLNKAGITFSRGNFITVSSASGTIARSKYLRDKFTAICENMEGAAIARVCQFYSLPCLELRCISNMVVDRQDQQWLVTEAIEECCRAVQAVIGGLVVD
jgi:futalosine hydrolase